MRLVGVLLLLLGLVAVVVGSMNGCSALFSWNGRHPVDTSTLVEEHTTRKLTPEPGRRYTLSIRIVFDRASVETEAGAAQVEAKLPLVVRVTDPAGTVRAEAHGWIDPAEPPNVLYGQSVKDTDRRTELAVERLVGPFISASDAPLAVDVDLGADRVGRARILERRLIVYDDALPRAIKNAFFVAAAGGVVLLAGAVITLVGWFRARSARTRRKRGGIPEPDVV